MVVAEGPASPFGGLGRFGSAKGAGGWRSYITGGMLLSSPRESSFGLTSSRFDAESRAGW